MNKPLPITARQVAAICKGAAKAGFVPFLEIGNAVVRLVPEDRVIPPQQKVVDEIEEEFEL